jgi:hypothetical protein
MARNRSRNQEVRLAHRAARAARRAAKLRDRGIVSFKFQSKYGSLRAEGFSLQPSFRKHQKVRVRVPQIFCLLDNPEESLRFIEKLQAILTNPQIRALHLDHKKCIKLGLDASVMMDTLILEAQESRSRRRRPRILVSGTHPDDVDVRIMLRATGILRTLGHPDSLLPDPGEMKIETCPMFRSRGADPRTSGDKDNAGTKIVEYFQRCFRLHGVQLLDEGASRLADLVTEVLGNSEEHGGRWYAIGYYTQKKGEDRGMCHIVLFDRGTTIYESMSSESAAPEIKRRVSLLATRHLERGFFGLGRAKPWDSQALWTLYALQQGVSSRLHQTASRGNGTVEIIRAFSHFGGPTRKMCILSGSSYIFFDERYDLESRPTENGETRQVMAFNASNDLEQPPDGDYVYALPNKFSGTIVSLRFTLDKEYLQKLVGQK